MNHDKRAFYQRRLLEELRQADCASSNWVRKLHQCRAREYQVRLDAMKPQSEPAKPTAVPRQTSEATEVGNWKTEL